MERGLSIQPGSHYSRSSVPTRIPFKSAYLAVAAALLASIMSGCIFNPKRDDGGPPPPPAEYPKLISPLDVLDALSLAYRQRDSVEFKLIYDDSYTGTSTDQQNPGGTLQIQFTKSDELSFIEALRRKSTITGVLLTFPPNPLRFTDLSDPLGWQTISIPSNTMTLEISDSPTAYTISTASQFEFKFIPTTPDSTSPTDTTWKIIRWTEFRP